MPEFGASRTALRQGPPNDLGETLVSVRLPARVTNRPAIPRPHSRMVVTGNPEQSDLLGSLSGLAFTARRLAAIADVAVVRLGETDIVRHPLTAGMLIVL